MTHAAKSETAAITAASSSCSCDCNCSCSCVCSQHMHANLINYACKVGYMWPSTRAVKLIATHIHLHACIHTYKHYYYSATSLTLECPLENLKNLCHFL